MLLKLVFSNFVFILYSVIFYVTLQTTMKLVKVKFQKSEWAEIKKFARDVFVKRCIYISWVYFINVYERLGLILFKTFPVQEVGWA